MPTGILTDPRFQNHDTGPHHPECPARLQSIDRALALLLPSLIPIPPRPATLDELALVHSPAYIEIARKDILADHGELSTGDTAVSHESWNTALLAAGGALEMTTALLAGKISNGFCALRPPGHHATPTRGMGFCIFNNIALAARFAQRRHNLKRILIVDWDVHHGNGTQDAFYDDPSVLFFSSHQHPLYPGTGMAHETGVGPGLGYTFNAPLPAGSGFTEISAALDALYARMQILRFTPDLILISAGFDSRIDDPLGQFTLTDHDFASLTRTLKSWANEFCQGRLISLLEGGYNLQTLGPAVAAHLAELAR